MSYARRIVCYSLPGSPGNHGEESADLQCHLTNQRYLPYALQPADPCRAAASKQALQTLRSDETSQDEHWNENQAGALWGTVHQLVEVHHQAH